MLQPSRRRALALALVAVLLGPLAGPATGPAAATGPAPNGLVSSSAVDGLLAAGPGSSSGTVTEHRGDVVEVTLTVGNATNVTVRVTTPNGTYAANLTATDRDGDGRVRLRWNTYLAGHGGAFAAAGEDTAIVLNETALAGRLPAGNHTVTATVDGERVDGATVRLTRPPGPSLRSLVTVPGRNATLSTVEDVRTARQAGHLRESKRAWLREVLVLELRAPGIAGALAAQDGPNASARFAGLTESEGFSFSLVEDWRTVGTQEDRLELRLTGRGTRLLADPANDSYYLLVDVDRARFANQDHELNEYDTGDWFDANVTVGPASGLVAERRNASVGKLVVSRPEVGLDDPVPPLVRPRRNQRLVADTNLPEGVDVTVLVRVLGSEFERRLAVPVTGGPDGNHVNASLDLSSLGPATKLHVRYFLEEREIGVGYRDQVQTAVVTDAGYAVSVEGVERTDAVGRTAVVTVNATLGQAGFVVLHADSAGGRVLGTSERLRPGDHPDLRVVATEPLRDVDRVVAVLHDDESDGETFEPPDEYGGDPAVVLNGTRVVAAAEVPPDETPTPTPSSTPTTTAPHPANHTPTVSPTPMPTTAPGFGLVTLALATLLALALLRRSPAGA